MPAEKEKLKGEYTGRWNARFTLTLINNKKKRIFKRGFKSKKEALEYERETILNNSKAATIPFKNAVNQFLEFKKPRIKESSYRVLELTLKSITYFDNILISEITPIQVSTFQNELIKTYKPRTIKNINSYIKMLFNWCVRYKGLATNPFNMVDRLKLETDKRMDIITIAEFNQIMEKIKNDDMKLIFKLLFWTGLRLGEARALKIDDILIQDIKEYLDKARYILDDNFIFRYNKSYYLAIFKDITLKVLGKSLRIHDLRHSHASFLINNGVDVLLISKRLEHTNTTMTLNTYSHLYPDKESEAIDLINKIKKD